MSILQSAQHFIRALKAPSDPPVVDGPPKICIAEQAWNDKTFHLPNKAEVITEWLLFKFFKERGEGVSSNPLCDQRYWKLLLDVLTSSAEAKHQAASSVNSSPWLKALLGRVAIVPIVTSFLNLWKDCDSSQTSLLLDYASRCISVLYPLGTQKLTTEALLEAWGTFVHNGLHLVEIPSAARVGAVLTKVYGDSLSNCSSRKKVNNNFLQNAGHFESWLKLLILPSTSQHLEPLRHSALSAGIETIFNLDTLRQLSESPDGTPLFAALHAAYRKDHSVVLKTLPLLFAQYTTSLRKHRAAIFSQGTSTQGASSRSETNIASMKFFASCHKVLDTEARDELTWNTISEMTDIVARENLYDSQSDPTSSLKHDVGVALEYLHDHQKVEQLENTTAIARCLSATARVDYDLVLPHMGQILSRFLTFPQSHADHFAFLDLLLEYHIKTRTIHQYIETLFSCLSIHETPSTSSPQARYATSLSSPILHPTHLEKLSKATQQFLTPSQCNSTVELACTTLRSLKEQHKVAERASVEASPGKASKKARKSLDSAMIVDQTVNGKEHDVLALSFVLSARLGQSILGSLPSSLPKHQIEEVRATVAEFQNDFVEHSLSKMVKSFVGKADGGSEDVDVRSGKRKAGQSVESTWGVQVVIIALLRLRYALRMARYLSQHEVSTSKLPKRLLSVASQNEDGVLPELSLEIIRMLLDEAFTLEEEDVTRSLDWILQYTEACLSVNPEASWSGFAHELTFGESGRAKSGVAALHLILERWLSVIDTTASEALLQKLARVIARIPLALDGPHRDQNLSAGHLLFRSLRSAQFWELHHLRSAILSHLEASTADLDSTDASPKNGKNSGKRKTHGSSIDAEVVSTYSLLLYFPVEYFSKASRSLLVKRAINADWKLAEQIRGEDVAASAAEYVALTLIRTFMKRTFGFLGSIEQQSPGDVADFILHLLQDVPSSVQGHAGYAQTSLELCELYFAELFKQAVKTDAGEACRVLDSYLQYAVFDDLMSVKARSLVSLVKLLNKEFAFSSFPSEVQTSLNTVNSRLAAVLESKLQSLLEKESSDLQDLPELLAYWHTFLVMGQWIGIQDSASFGERLARRLNLKVLTSNRDHSSKWVDTSCVMTVAILLQELHYLDEMERSAQLDIIVAAYVCYRRILSAQGLLKMDEYVAKSCRQLSTTNFEYILGLVEGSLAAGSSSSIADLVHLSTVLLQNHPSNTLRIVQSFFTQCLDIFVNNDQFTLGDCELRTRTLDLIAQHCSERPAALRSLDMGSTWALLSKYLAPSLKHDKSTSTTIFHKICAVVNAVIRLRRDLVSPMLPHLGMVLRQLILSMRQCRPQLASKQTELVMSTQPKWINASQSLGIPEARALSRVLETLTTKTITRVHAATTDSQKAESLATPFAKHAAYVLKAYIEAMNDPLCVLGLDVRKELYPGLYALCSMIGEHSRDALMVSALDAGGKATLKALWKEYEKQRYVGRG